jgi:hypothetical protein
MYPLEGSGVARAHGADCQVGRHEAPGHQSPGDHPGGQYLEYRSAECHQLATERGRPGGGVRIGRRRRQPFGHLGQDPLGVSRTNDIG